MANEQLVSTLTGLLEQRAASAGVELVCVEIAGPKTAPIVRVFLDRQGGIDIEAIAGANPWIQEALDGVADLGDRYTLEVSSPGIERPLRTAKDFERFAGSKAKLSVSEPVDGRRSLVGTLKGVEDDTVLIDVDGTLHRIPLGAVEKARLRVEIDFNKEGLDGI